MHETDAFRDQVRTEAIARWWIPYTLYFADYTRESVLTVYHNKAILSWTAPVTLEFAELWAISNNYVRCIGEVPE